MSLAAGKSLGGAPLAPLQVSNLYQKIDALDCGPEVIVHTRREIQRLMCLPHALRVALPMTRV